MITGMLVLPGGLPGTTNLEVCEPLMQAVDVCICRALVAICAAPSIYASVDCLRVRRLRLIQVSSIFFSENGANLSQDAVCADGSFITSQGAGTALSLVLRLFAIL